MSASNTRLHELVKSAKTVVARNDRQAAAQLVDSFQAYSPHQLNLEQLIASADIFYIAELRDLASQSYETAHSAEPTFYWPIFQIARLRLQNQEFEAALGLLERVTTLEPQFAWGWYELCRCLHRLGQAARLTAAAKGFAQAKRVALTTEHITSLAETAHYLFEQKLRQEPFEIYSILLDSGCDDDLVRTRHAEFYTWRKEYHTVVSLLAPHLEARSLGAWGKRALALAYEELGQIEDACWLLEELVREKPRIFLFTRDLVRLFASQGHSARASQTLSNARSFFGPEQQLELEVVVLTESRQHLRLLELVERTPDALTSLTCSTLDRAIAECAYREKQHDVAAKLIAIREQRFGLDEQTAVCAINVAFARRRWEDCEQVLQRIPLSMVAVCAELKLKKFEYFCFIKRFDSAAIALKALEPFTNLSKQHVLPVAKFYAETGNWSAAFGLLLERLDGDFAFGDLGFLLVRAIRKTRSHNAALREVEKACAIHDAPDLYRLKAALLEDLANNHSAAQSLLNDARIGENSNTRQRLRIKQILLRPANETIRPARFAIYYCCDAAYLGPSLVSLVSLIDSNRDLLDDCDIYLVTENDNQAILAREIAARISRIHGLRDIIIKTRADIIGSETILRQSYGLFTGGHVLAEAAYYRIFFAEYLRALGIYQRALYIDSDTIVKGDLNGLLNGPRSAPLVARREVDRPEIAEAIRLHKFEPGRYFNSGVLLFDFSDLRLELGLKRSIYAITHSRNSLIFQDQCALNLGFQNLFAELDAHFNWFVSPFEQKPSDDGAILHFLDRPKPWDSVYDGELGRLWLLNFYKLSRLAGHELTARLHATLMS